MRRAETNNREPLPCPPVRLKERERELAQLPEYDPERDLIFYSHIHKTSGTSLRYSRVNVAVCKAARGCRVGFQHRAFAVSTPALRAPILARSGEIDSRERPRRCVRVADGAGSRRTDAWRGCALFDVSCVEMYGTVLVAVAIASLWERTTGMVLRMASAP